MTPAMQTPAMTQPKSALIVGAGLGGLASACLLAKNGWKVTIVEKNSQAGGRVGLVKAQGFRFDTGPSWLLMPEVFEHFFALLGENLNEQLKLTRLSPAFRVFYPDGQNLDLHADHSRDAAMFDQIEPGSGKQLRKYLAAMEYQYSLATKMFLYKNYNRRRDFFTPRMLREGLRMGVLRSLDQTVYRQFKSPELRQILEFAALFLGTRPSETPALYGILNHALLNQGVFYPSGGMYKLIEATVRIAQKHGANFQLGTEVKQIIVERGRAVGVITAGDQQLRADIVISNADLHHTEQKLLSVNHRTKSEAYWQKATLAPSALIMHLGVKGRLPSLSHHNILFNKDWEQNFTDIFGQSKSWPTNPSLYICKPSQTDTSVAPTDHENLFALIPVTPGLDYTQSQLDAYGEQVLQLIEARIAVPNLRQRIVYKQLYCSRDFAQQFNSYRGSALGLAHTLRQTAVFRPSNINSKVKNLYYVGAGTNPGIGMPPALISAELLYKRLTNDASSGPLRGAINL